jgi:septal ring factor EnvC (AmiA/AmiB activator)
VTAFRRSGAASGENGMNLIGKIFVFAVFVMSLVFMSFAAAIYSSHTNWREEIERTADQVQPGKQLGYKYQLEELKKERESLQTEITSLQEKVSVSEAARDQVVAKLQYALNEKSGELDKLREQEKERENDRKQSMDEMTAAREELKTATAEVEKLREGVRQQQAKVDEQVDRAAKLAADLYEKESFLEIANERKAQLEKQVANARLLLQQSGLSIDSPPKDRVPAIDGLVTAVADDSVELSLGGDDGVQMGHELEVFRDGQYLGRVRVVSVKPDKAIAIVIKQFSRGIIQRGDRVATRLKA